jgi:tetratricopeptide (TPR) repeat protein
LQSITKRSYIGKCLSGGAVYCRASDQQTHFEKAIELHTQSLNLARDIGDLHGESIALSNLANDYYELGDRKKAREYDEQSLDISRKIGDKLGEHLVLQNMNSPRSFSTLEEFETAIENYEELLEASRHDNNPLEEFRCLYQLGMIYLELGVPPKAIEYLDLALTKSRQIGDKDKELHCLGNLGNIFGMLGDDQLAIQICGEALELAREVGDRLSEGNNLRMLGLAYAGLGEMKKACMFWKEAFDILENIKSPIAENVRNLLREAECE